MHFLDKVELAYSCPLRWEKLLGDDKRRFCAECQKHVTNLSAMTRGQAESWLRAHSEAPVCVRVEVDPDGKAIHRPALSAAAVVALSLSAAACGNDDDSAGGASGTAANLAAQSERHVANPTHTDGADGTGIPELTGSEPTHRPLMGAPPKNTVKLGDVAAPHPTMGRPARPVEWLGEPAVVAPPEVVVGKVAAPPAER